MSILNASDLERFVAADPDGPVVMLNLLRFVPDGAARYMRYIERFTTSGLNERYGVSIVYVGTGHPALVAADGGDWDMVALVSYPSRRSFVDMVNDPDYEAFEHLRTEAVADAVLQPTTTTAL
ncbi:hypothetical protein L2K20_06915 [Mycobacterium sp. MBM]|nr:hypothetical protein [Mycobacterium sp. MBM]